VALVLAVVALLASNSQRACDGVDGSSQMFRSGEAA
jgi:hypothetical protein